MGEESRAVACARPCLAASCGVDQVDLADLDEPRSADEASARAGDDALGNGNFDAAVRISLIFLSGDDGLDVSVASSGSMSNARYADLGEKPRSKPRVGDSPRDLVPSCMSIARWACDIGEVARCDGMSIARYKEPAEPGVPLRLISSCGFDFVAWSCISRSCVSFFASDLGNVRHSSQAGDSILFMPFLGVADFDEVRSLPSRFGCSRCSVTFPFLGLGDIASDGVSLGDILDM